MEEKDFQREVIENLASLNTGQMEVIRRLDKGEQRFDSISNQLQAHRDALLSHANSCPLKGSVEDIRRDLDRGNHPGSVAVGNRVTALENNARACEASSNTWHRILDIMKPVIWIVLGLVFSLIIMHQSGLFIGGEHPDTDKTINGSK